MRFVATGSDVLDRKTLAVALFGSPADALTAAAWMRRHPGMARQYLWSAPDQADGSQDA